MKTKVQYYTISDQDNGQRIDNFLITKLKNVPKSHIYRIIRKGEVRVNKRRIDVFYRLIEGDQVRLPPVAMADNAKHIPPSKNTTDLLAQRILYEDNHIIVINKPSGMSVHAGSTVRMGVIETMRHLYPRLPHLELAHRLDSETSGCLVLAKKKTILRELHTELREGRVEKIYWTLTQGKWKDSELNVNVALQKDYQDGGKHIVKVNAKGKSALTVFRTVKSFKRQASLMEVKLYTGRTHQIRVHAQYKNHVIAGDDRYGNAEFNQLCHQLGLRRLFLHAKTIAFTLPSLAQPIRVEAPLDRELLAVIHAFETRYV